MVLLINVVHIGKVRPLENDNNIVFHINTVNRADYDFEEARVTLYMPDFGWFYRTTQYDLDSNNVKVKQIEVNLEEDVSGYFPVRITLSNDEERKVKYTWVYIN